ncbi:MAG: hypothetical protein EPO64_03045 [Nitrospirae bacterium]|nr:MAG: hypothetical protein EPO64_03045 [Nitrospirota bacterium]
MPLKVRHANLIFVVFIVALGLVGGLLGHSLARYPKLETFKLLNIVGLVYDLLGIIVLSEVVAKNERLKAFMVKWVAGFLIWAQSVVPLGALFGAWVGSSLPSSSVAVGFFASFFVYSVFVLTVIDSTVFFPRLARFQSLSFRTRTFGLVLLITGVFIQLVAAFKDLNA